MTTMLFLSLVLLEMALMVCRMKTGTIRRDITAILRGLSMLTLAALCILSVIEWGFRYYALAATLVISTAVSVVQWLRRKAPEAERGRARFVGRAASMTALLFVASLPAIIFPEYEPLPTTGRHQVKTSVRYFADERRVEAYNKRGGARALAVEFWYPEQAAGSFPLIVFSHGAFGTRTSNETLFRALASHGYVVCSIDHTHQCLYTTLENGEPIWVDGGYMHELRSENAKENKQNSLALYRKWMGTRVADIDFVIDTIAAQTKTNAHDALYGLIDIRRIGAIGHSLGGSAALGIGRMRSDIGAVIALEAPFLCDILDVEDDSFVFEHAAYPAPVLNVYSDSSWTNLARWPQYAQNARLRSGQHKDAYNLHMEGTGHLSLTDLSLASPLLTRMLNGRGSSVGAEDCLIRLNEVCLSFFDRFLKHTTPEALPPYLAHQTP